MPLNHYFLLPAYVSFDTLRSILLYGALQTGSLMSPSAITFGYTSFNVQDDRCLRSCRSEALKLAFAIALLLQRVWEKHGSISFSGLADAINLKEPTTSTYVKGYMLYALPSLLYFTNNILFLIGLQYTTPSLQQAAILAKIPITAILHHFMVRRQRRLSTWLSLTTLSLGIVIFQNPLAIFDRLVALVVETYKTKSSSSVSAEQSLIGTVIGLVIACISGLTSIYTELILKQDVPFWTAQVSHLESLVR